MTNRISEQDMQALLSTLQIDDAKGLTALDAATTRYPGDPRLFLLKGSVLAGAGRLIEAHTALSQAVEIAPDFHIARFQLGFFELTSGEVDTAIATWTPLDRLPDGHYLRIFATGLGLLIRDKLRDCIAILERGIVSNEENLPLNADMRLIIEQIAPLAQKQDMTDADMNDQDETSTTSALLQQFGSATKH